MFELRDGRRRVAPALTAIATLMLAVCGQAATDAKAAAAQTRDTIPAAAAGHPRLLVRASDLPRLRSWASSRNPVYARGLRRLALAARARMDAGTVPREDTGQFRYETYPTELYAELFAFMSLIDPNATARADWGRRARTLLLYVIDRALPGKGREDEAFRNPEFSTSDRSRFYGEAYGLTLDWAYSSFSAADKAKIHKVFVRWADEQYAAYPLNQLPSGTVPTATGRSNDARLLRNRNSVRWSLNNYYIAHARNLGLMSLAFDAADDPGNGLRRNIRNLTGQWLFLMDRAMSTDAAGGLSPEGFEYGAESMGRLAQLLYALRTAGQGASGGRQARFEGNRFWKDSIPALLSSLPTQPHVPIGDNAFLGPVFQPAWFGDGETYWSGDPITLVGPLGLNAAQRGDKRTLNATRWMVKHVPPGGKTSLLARVGNTDSFFGAILYFLLLDPRSAEPTDPRRTLPLTHIAPGIHRILARTCWCRGERLFTYMLAWSAVDHQRGDGNDFGFLRKGEWLTKVRVGYSNPFTDYHNAVTIQGDPFSGDPDDYRTIGSASGSQWGLAPAGDPTVLAQGSGRGYVYALGDATKLYNSPSQGIRGVSHASRSIVWLKPDRIVVYDRAVTPKANRFKRFWLQLPAAAQVSGNRATVRTPRGQRLFVTTLEPGNATIRGEAAANDGYPAVDEPMRFRLSVEATGRPRSARFLHVLQGADGNAQPSPSVDLRSSGGTAFAGAAVAGTAVLFPESLRTRFSGFTVDLPAGVHRVLVTGLKPRSGHTVRREGNLLRVSPGGPTAANRAGVLDLASI